MIDMRKVKKACINHFDPLVLPCSIRGFILDSTFLNLDSLKLFASICCFLFTSSLFLGEVSKRGAGFLPFWSFSSILMTASRSACSYASSLA